MSFQEVKFQKMGTDKAVSEARQVYLIRAASKSTRQEVLEYRKLK